MVKDVEVDLSDAAVNSQQGDKLQKVAHSCNNVLAEIETTIDRYCEISTQRSVKRVWKRLKWEPDEVRDFRNRLCSNIGLLNAINGRITRDGVLELLKHKTNEQDQMLLDWLSSKNYAAQQCDYISRRQPGTGEWFLESSKFKIWIETPAETLFCPGIPGSGKTILASVVIDELQSRYGNNPDVGIAYIFCTFQQHDDQSQKPESLLASILQKLTRGMSPIPDIVKDLFEKHRTKGTRPSINAISRALRSIVSQFSRAFIVIDALDECYIPAISRLLDEVFNLQTSSNLNILATSRLIPEIMARFQDKPIQEISAPKPDVIKYINSNLGKLPSFVSRDWQLQQEIRVGITDAVDGMWVPSFCLFPQLSLYIHLTV